MSELSPKSSLVGRAMHAALERVPERVLNRVGGWELCHPRFRSVVRRALRPMQASDTIISQGAGAGLHFNSAGGFPSCAIGVVRLGDQDGGDYCPILARPS